MRRPNEVITDEWTAVSVITSELIILAKAHPKKAFIILVFHVWVYSLVFQHLNEIKTIYQLIPFIN